MDFQISGDLTTSAATSNLARQELRLQTFSGKLLVKPLWYYSHFEGIILSMTG
jgi:hypothetical protein